MTLQTFLRLNAASCVGFGGLFVAVPGVVAGFLGAEPQIAPLVIRSVGAILVLNGVHLVWAAAQRAPARSLIVWFSLGDFCWSIGTIALVVRGGWITTPNGTTATALVAIFVGVLGLAQLTMLSSKKPITQ